LSSAALCYASSSQPTASMAIAAMARAGRCMSAVTDPQMDLVLVN
jgi:hypothetical protein